VSTAIVTGSEGFIGRHMVTLLLENGYEVRGFDKTNPCWLGDDYDFPTGGNILDLREDAFSGADYVFHFAGIADIVPSVEHPKPYIQTNVLGTVNVLQAAQRAGVRKFLYAASSSCYGPAPDCPTFERHRCDPAYPYALSKYLGEQAVLHWSRLYKMPAASLRIFNAYGPGQRTNGAYGSVFSTFLAQRANAKPLTIVGDGTQRRDFVHVSDVVRAFLMVAESDDGGIYNVGSGEPQSINRLADLIEGPRIYIPHRAGEPAVTHADIHKIHARIGWEPLVTFEDGVLQMVGAMDEWKSAPVWTAESIAAETRAWNEALA
jgi:UDP-glucose 4-epimerase